MRRSLFLITVLAMSLLGCGGGGGGGGSDFVGAARVSIRATPRTIDVGDRTLVEIDVRDAHPDGISLKVRYPVGLEYETATSFLDVDGQFVDIDPGTEVVVEDVTYLVYYLPQAIFGQSGFGRVSFQLEGRSEITDGLIEVDPDADYTRVLDPSSPEFSPDDDVSVTVID